MPADEEAQRNEVRKKAKSITELRQMLAIQGRNGLIINGTADDPAKVAKIKELLEKLGYETSMLMVNTKDEVSQQRNIERGQREVEVSQKTFVKKNGIVFKPQDQNLQKCLVAVTWSLITPKTCVWHHQMLLKRKNKKCFSCLRMFKSLFLHHRRVKLLNNGLVEN